MERNLLGFLAICMTAGWASAQEPCCLSTRDCGPPRVACYAQLSENCHDIGYYVGGGCHRHSGQERNPDEGTWGWDSKSFLPAPAVVLRWCHCSRYQQGPGAYRTVGNNRNSISTP
jgi:hypothetical protein